MDILPASKPHTQTSAEKPVFSSLCRKIFVQSDMQDILEIFKAYTADLVYIPEAHIIFFRPFHFARRYLRLKNIILNKLSQSSTCGVDSNGLKCLSRNTPCKALHDKSKKGKTIY